MNSADTQYLEVMQDLLDNGVYREGRNGGTYGLFGRQLRFDLSEGFPLLTTKKVHFHSVVVELLWFLRGDTNTKYLEDHGVTIWREWADEKGELGPVYPHQWRKFGAKPERIPMRKPNIRKGVAATYLGVANGAGSHGHPLGKTWEGMIARCYDPESPSYGTYGAVGVHVCDEWMEFSKFASDAVNLPGYDMKEAGLGPRYVLDKDIRGGGFVYSPDTCTWVTDSENILANPEFLYVVAKDGVEYHFTSPRQFCSKIGIDDRNFSDLWTGNKNAKTRYGFEFVSKTKLRPGVDQIANLIAGLKSAPYGRRHVVTAWNPSQVDEMALPPCHCLFQFHVANGRLSCRLDQRSADWFLGSPFNIASYALLTHLIAREVNLGVGDLVYQLGDLHLYANHVEQAEEQIKRTPRYLPTLDIRADAEKTIFDLEPSDIAIIGYDPHPAIKAEVSK